MIFPKFSRPIWTKISKIFINTEVNIDEVEQKTLLTICTTKLHRCYRVTLHFLDFHQKRFPKSPPLLLPSQEYITIVIMYEQKKCYKNSLVTSKQSEPDGPVSWF